MGGFGPPFSVRSVERTRRHQGRPALLQKHLSCNIAAPWRPWIVGMVAATVNHE